MSQAATLGAPYLFGNQPIVLQQINARQYFSPRSAKSVIALGALQLMAGTLSIALKITAAVYYIGFMNVVFGGVWCGALYWLAGLLGVLAGKRNTKKLIISFLVFNIIVSALTWALFALSVMGLFDEKYSIKIPVHSALIVLSIFEFIVAITSAAYCCRGLKCCSETTPVFVVQQGTSAPGNVFALGPSIQPTVLQQGSSAIFTAQTGLSTTALSTQMHIPSHQELLPSNTACRVYNQNGYYYSATTPPSDEAMYTTIAPYDYIDMTK